MCWCGMGDVSVTVCWRGESMGVCPLGFVEVQLHFFMHYLWGGLC